jgi:hypothetical protein
MSTNTTTSPSVIDKKKQNVSSQSGKPNYVTFIRTTLTQVVHLLIFIVIGCVFLYSCKVAQAGLLPTSTDYVPFTNTPIPLESPTVTEDINVLKTSNGVFSTKITFPTETNMKILTNTFGFINDWKTGPKSTVTKLYFASLIENLASCIFTIKTKIYKLCNSFLSESVIIIFGGLMGFFIELMLGFVTFFYTIYLLFSNISVFFSTAEKTDTETTWTAGNMWDIINLPWTILYIVILVIILLLLFGVLPLLIVIFIIFVSIFPIFMSATYRDSPDKKFGFTDLVKSTFKFKMKMIMIIVSIFVVMNASTYISSYSAVIAVVACCILYFFSSTYSDYKPKPYDFSTIGASDYTNEVIDKPAQ